jgi:hypothetical protein
MGRYKRFTFLVNGEERAAIKSLAERLQRSESDAVRLVVREAVRELSLPPPTLRLESHEAAPAGNEGSQV